LKKYLPNTRFFAIKIDTTSYVKKLIGIVVARISKV